MNDPGGEIVLTQSHEGYTQSSSVEEDVIRHLAEAMEIRRQRKKGQLFPSDLITRGSDRKVLGKGEATSSEFMLGLLKLELHPSMDEADIAPLRRFTLNIASDTCRLPWPVVRQYGEETFAALAEGTIPGGWSNETAIDKLRTDGIAIACHSTNNQHQPSHRSYQPGPAQMEKKRYDREVHGTACPFYSKGEKQCKQATTGESHKMGENKVTHICGYCANVRKVFAMHSEADCICKAKANNRPDFF